jgi:hypothetical protein
MASFNSIAELFRIAAHDRRWGAAPPSDKSITSIEQSLGLRIPSAYRRIAIACQNYGAYLNGIGEDFDHEIHILRVNRVFHDTSREPGDMPALPVHFVMITHGDDGECFCWDVRQQTATGEHPIVHIGLESAWDGTPARVRIDKRQFLSFHAFLEDQVIYYASNVESRLATRASKLIHEISKDRTSDT